jgi:hypothetical protein
MGSWSWQLLRRHALDVLVAIGVNDVALEHHLNAQSTVRIRRSERRGQHGSMFYGRTIRNLLANLMAN